MIMKNISYIGRDLFAGCLLLGLAFPLSLTAQTTQTTPYDPDKQ